MSESFVTSSIGAVFERRTERGIKGLPLMSITMGGGMVERQSLDRRVETNLSDTDHLLVRSGDLAYNMMRLWQGVVGRAPCDCLVSPAYVVLRPRDIDSAFAEYLFRHESTIAKFRQFSQGVVDDRLRLYAHDLMKIPISYPKSLRTQRRIAAVLRTVDEVIEATEARIAKQQTIKQGLLHDLFTRGVTSDGQLRPPATERPAMYQDTDLGNVPGDWLTHTLGRSCQWHSGGTPSRSRSDWWTGDYPWLTPKDMKSFDLHDTSEHVTEAAALSGSRIVPSGSVFIVVRGMILAHTFPVVVSSRPFAFNQDIKAITSERLMGRFLGHLLTAFASFFLSKTSEATHGTKRFDLNDILRIRVGIPEKQEQMRMVERVDEFDRSMISHVDRLSKLRHLKCALLQDLLTGRVSADTIDLDALTDAIP